MWRCSYRCNMWCNCKKPIQKKGRENASLVWDWDIDEWRVEAYYNWVKYYIDFEVSSDFYTDPRTDNPLVVQYEEWGTPEKAAEIKEKLTFYYSWGEDVYFTMPVGERLAQLYGILRETNRESLIPLWVNQAITDALNGDRQYHLTHYYHNWANPARVDWYAYFTDDYNDSARYCREPYSEWEWWFAWWYEDKNYSVMSEDNRGLFTSEDTFVPDEIYQRIINLPYENTPVEAIYPDSSEVSVAVWQQKSLWWFDTDPRRTVWKVNVSIDHPEIATFELQDAWNIWVTWVSMWTATITLSYGNISETITVTVNDR